VKFRLTISHVFALCLSALYDCSVALVCVCLFCLKFKLRVLHRGHYYKTGSRRDPGTGIVLVGSGLISRNGRSCVPQEPLHGHYCGPGI
jgi:hypothetical protein